MLSTAKSQAANLAGMVHSITRATFGTVNSILTESAEDDQQHSVRRYVPIPNRLCRLPLADSASLAVVKTAGVGYGRHPVPGHVGIRAAGHHPRRTRSRAHAVAASALLP